MLAEAREALRETRQSAVAVRFRSFLASPDYCATEPSPLIAAIMDASEGIRPDTIDDAQSERHFGCTLDGLPTTRPRTAVVRAGGRGGKTSRLLAPKALHAAWTVPLPLLGKGEEGYSILVAPSMALARQAFSFCRGYVEASPVLRAALVSEPTQESLALRRPDGCVVRVQVFAAGRGGAQLRAKSLVFAGFDEAAFFRDEASGVVNDAELYRAVLQRVVPEGQVWIVTTPWLAGVGLVEEFIAKDFGTHEHALCAVAPTRALNPAWDPTGEVEADLRAQDPDAAEREIDAIPQAQGTAQFFSPHAIDAAVDDSLPLRLPRQLGATYTAGGDAGFRRNSSTLAIVESADGRLRLAMLDEIRPEPGVPLKPAGVVDTFAPSLKSYGIGFLVADSHERDEVNRELARHSLSAVPCPEGQGGKAEMFIAARTALHEGRLKLPKHPRLIRQLKDVVGRPMPGGGLSISSPQRVDGSHGDLVSALVAAVWKAAAPAAPASRSIRIRALGI